MVRVEEIHRAVVEGQGVAQVGPHVAFAGEHIGVHIFAALGVVTKCKRTARSTLSDNLLRTKLQNPVLLHSVIVNQSSPYQKCVKNDHLVFFVL
jgi:hypothetical protein